MRGRRVVRERAPPQVPDSVEQRADRVCHNLPGLEAAWAHRCSDFADEHEAFLQRVPRNARTVRLTSADDDVHTKFRALFPDLSVAVVSDEGLKNPAAKDLWRPFCMHFENRVEDFNFGTLLRLDASKPYSPENTTLVPRVQFIAIELARLREGLNAPVMAAERPGAEDEVFFMRVCAVCGKEAPFRCTQCKTVRYCSAECQRADWKKHKPECK